jgi:23S rRNA G2069 N7-methylase RlmK/C1962 C5-methylase RlmI
MLENRLRKNDRHLRRWARREGVGCYRVYDCDIPEIPVCIDRYGEALVLAWFAPELAPPGAGPTAWLDAMVAAAGRALDVPLADIHARIRAPQKGAEQYVRLAPAPALRIVHEGGLAFEVDLAAHVDVGLFLDHRPLRAEVHSLAAGRDVLNLFAYTGAFTVHAAAGGARTTTSVDLNNTYLAMARRNLELNGFRDEQRHRLIRADVMAWLREPTRDSFDIAIVDPPTFSNSKKMAGIFDVQRDHPELLAGVIRLMRPGGRIFFSTNHRRFRPDFDALAAFGDVARRVRHVEEISARTVPPDFRDRRIHRAWSMELH